MGGKVYDAVLVQVGALCCFTAGNKVERAINRLCCGAKAEIASASCLLKCRRTKLFKPTLLAELSTPEVAAIWPD